MDQVHALVDFMSYPAKSRGQIRTTYFVSRVSRLLAMSQIFVIVVSSYVMTSLSGGFYFILQSECKINKKTKSHHVRYIFQGFCQDVSACASK